MKSPILCCHNYWCNSSDYDRGSKFLHHVFSHSLWTLDVKPITHDNSSSHHAKRMGSVRLAPSYNFSSYCICHVTYKYTTLVDLWKFFSHVPIPGSSFRSFLEVSKNPSNQLYGRKALLQRTSAKKKSLITCIAWGEVNSRITSGFCIISLIWGFTSSMLRSWGFRPMIWQTCDFSITKR